MVSFDLNITATMQSGEKPVFCFQTGFDTHLAKFDVTINAKNGTTMVVPTCTIHLGNALSKTVAAVPSESVIPEVLGLMAHLPILPPSSSP